MPGVCRRGGEVIEWQANVSACHRALICLILIRYHVYCRFEEDESYEISEKERRQRFVHKQNKLLICEMHCDM